MDLGFLVVADRRRVPRPSPARPWAGRPSGHRRGRGRASRPARPDRLLEADGQVLDRLAEIGLAARSRPAPGRAGSGAGPSDGAERDRLAGAARPLRPGLPCLEQRLPLQLPEVGVVRLARDQPVDPLQRRSERAAPVGGDGAGVARRQAVVARRVAAADLRRGEREADQLGADEIVAKLQVGRVLLPGIRALRRRDARASPAARPAADGSGRRGRRRAPRGRPGRRAAASPRPCPCPTGRSR